MSQQRLVPVIDIGRDPSVVAGETDDVCRRVGFFQVVGHGVSPGVIDAAWREAVRFFDLPLEQQRTVERPFPGHPYGYVPMSKEALSRSLDNQSAPDLKEVYNIGPVDRPPRPWVDDDEAMLFASNPWPEMLPELRPAMEAYFRAMLVLCDRLMGLFALAIGLPEDFFADKIDQTHSAMRALNYPDQDRPPAPGQLRAGAHTDYGTFTILRQDDAPGGLEVQDPHSGGWVPIPSVPDAFVINVGDMLERWTNDRWRSTMHRVVNPPPDMERGTRRQSIAFFHNANYDCEVACLPNCSSPDDPPRYEPVLAGPHLMSKFRKTVET